MNARRAQHGNRSGILLNAVFFLYIGICIFAFVWMRSSVITLEYEIGALENLRTDLLSERKMIVAQQASFLSAGNVEKVAFRRLGMSMAERGNIIYVTRAVVAGPRRASMR